MYAKFCVNRETANNFMRLFVNRRAYAIQGERPLPNGSVPYYPARDWKTKEPKPLDDGVVRMHLNGDITISLYAINPETQRSKWVAIDADFDGALDSLFQLQWELKQDGVDAALNNPAAAVISGSSAPSRCWHPSAGSMSITSRSDSAFRSKAAV